MSSIASFPDSSSSAVSASSVDSSVGPSGTVTSLLDSCESCSSGVSSNGSDNTSTTSWLPCETSSKEAGLLSSTDSSSPTVAVSGAASSPVTSSPTCSSVDTSKGSVISAATSWLSFKTSSMEAGFIVSVSFIGILSGCFCVAAYIMAIKTIKNTMNMDANKNDISLNLIDTYKRIS